MSRRDSLAAVERRVRRIAVRNGLNLLKPQNPDKRVLEHGGYQLRDVESYEIVFGGKPYPYCADLDEIEAYLLALEAERKGQGPG